MMAIFFIGIGASSILAAGAETPLQIAFGWPLSVFAAIYHPVGLAMVVHGREKTGVALAINGIFGNLGVASAALITGYLVDRAGWREAFVLPGLLSVLIGIAYAALFIAGRKTAAAEGGRYPRARPPPRPASSAACWSACSQSSSFSTAVGGLIFQSTTFALPKIFDERLGTSPDRRPWWAGTHVHGFHHRRFRPARRRLSGGPPLGETVFAFVAGLQAMFLAAMVQMTGLGALIVSVAFMLFVFGQIPINDVLVGRATKSEWRSRVFALRYVLTFSIAATASPLSPGFTPRGFSALFIVLAAAAAAIFCSVLMLPRTGPVLGGAGRAVPVE